MTRPYNELVGILATFSKPTRSYRIDYVYRYKNGQTWGEILTQHGLDWVLLTAVKTVRDGLLDAFASAIHKVYMNETQTYNQMFLQLVGNQTPGNLHLPGPWSMWAER